MTFSVLFIDSGREPECKPDPKYPRGIELDLRPEDRRTPLHAQCCYSVPYPAPRCGQYLVVCDRCGYCAIVTVTGRADDPRSITLPCKGN